MSEDAKKNKANKMPLEKLKEEWDFPISADVVLEYLIKYSGAAISIKNNSGDFLFVNNALVKAFGKKNKDEIIGKNIRDIFNHELSENYVGDDKIVLERSETLRSVSERIEISENDLRWQLSTKSPTFINDEVSGVVTVSQDMTERKRMEDELRYYSETDGLTGIFNRRVFDMMIVREWDRARRNNYPLTLIIMDIDYFKRFNDMYGHQKGDDALKGFASILKGQTKRPGDMACRYGGEEFVMLLPATDLKGATTVGKRIVERLADLAIPHEDSEVSNSLTVSWGVATIKPSKDSQTDELIRRADIALYEAKRNGRNTFSTWTPKEKPFA